LLATRFITGTNENLSLTISASFGLATFPEDGDTMHSIIRSADAMMYVAKAEGRNRLAVADPNKPTEFTTLKTSRHA
jgi:diguanylate cyclase (GGDEF)-like protein